MPNACNSTPDRSIGTRKMAQRFLGGYRVWLVVAMVAWPAFQCVGLSTTTKKTYQYNSDGAPTAVTTQVDGGTPSTVYLTWDNFVPSVADPTTGTVARG